MSLTGLDPRSGRNATQVQALIDAETAGDVTTLIATEAAARNAAIAAAVGLAQFDDIIEPVLSYRAMGTSTAAALVANTVYLYRFRVARPIAIANAVILNGATVAGNVALGVYTRSGTTYTKVASTADTAQAGVSTFQTIPLVSPSTYALVPGVDYWAAFGGTNNTATLLRLSVADTEFGAFFNMQPIAAAVYSSGLPTPISAPGNGGGATFWMAFTT